MNLNIQSFLNLPGPVKLVVAALSGASLMGIAFSLFRGNSTLYTLLLVIFAVAALLGLLFRLYLRVSRKKKAKKMDSVINQHNLSAPSGVSGAEARVKLDDLRQRFASGIQNYKNHGKDLYSLPWYVIVGEPGSGKTECIRRSGVGFPPNLQDEQQGVGGTINMNWWFTNHAVILDTAGRLLFETVAPGTTSEWKEFLGLLRRSRPDCPINGLILAIPTDSLIKDTSADIEAKAKRIAVQLDEIQRVLDIRFPVFVLITKTDLVPGFREFFKDVKDPDLEHQMIGWSNPAPLDAAFNPHQVDDYLAGLVASIEKRRYPLLREPDHSAAGDGARWIDKIDSVYTFPRALEEIIPRLRRFLELIFVAGEWAQKPLFLRGIYITSSLQEGAVLDQELAKALDIKVQDLPEDISFVRKGALFLRDVYIEKIFREKGLVTRATNAGKVVKRRQLLVFGAGFVALFASLGLAWFASAKLRASIGDQQAYWSAAAADARWTGDRWNPMIVEHLPISDEYAATEARLLSVDGRDVPFMEFLPRLVEYAQTPIRTPAIFKPVEWISRGLTRREIDRNRAVRVIFEQGVVLPLLSGTRDLLTLGGTEWNEKTREALLELLRLERHIIERQAGQSPDFDESRELVPNFMSFLTGDPGDSRWVEVAEWVYRDAPRGRDYWPPLWASGGATWDANKPIRDGVERFLGHVRAQAAAQQANLALIESMSAELRRIDDAERNLFVEANRSEETGGDALVSGVRRILVDDLLPAARRFRELRDEAYRRGLAVRGEAFFLKAAYENEMRAAREVIQHTVEEIEGQLAAPEVRDSRDPDSVDNGALGLFEGLRLRLEEAKVELARDVASGFTPEQLRGFEGLDADLLAHVGGEPALDARLSIYRRIMEMVEVARNEDSPIGRLASRLEGLEALAGPLRQSRQSYRGPRETDVDTLLGRVAPDLETRHLRRLVADYEAAVFALSEEIRFPLVLPVSSDGLTTAELERIIRFLGLMDGDLRPAVLERFPHRERERLAGLMTALRPVHTVGRVLLAARGAAQVEIRLPGQEVQNNVLARLLDGESAAHVNFRWEEVRLNDGSRVRTRRPTGETLGSVGLDSSRVALGFFSLGREDPRPLEFTGAWAPLQWLLSGRSVVGSTGRDLNILVSRSAEDQTFHMVVSLVFPEAPPPIDGWPRRDSLPRAR